MSNKRKKCRQNLIQFSALSAQYLAQFSLMVGWLADLSPTDPTIKYLTHRQFKAFQKEGKNNFKPSYQLSQLSVVVRRKRKEKGENKLGKLNRKAR